MHFTGRRTHKVTRISPLPLQLLCVCRSKAKKVFFALILFKCPIKCPNFYSFNNKIVNVVSGVGQISPSEINGTRITEVQPSAGGVAQLEGGEAATVWWPDSGSPIFTCSIRDKANWPKKRSRGEARTQFSSRGK